MKFQFQRGQRMFLLVVAAGLTLVVYLLISQATVRMGFPLDDAWIHQTYARNLAGSGEWAFIPGQHSAGSTSPLWTVLITLGYWLGLAPLTWTYILGWLALAGLAITCDELGRALYPDRFSHIPWLGLFIIGEWHLVWAAGSGMETSLYAFAVMVVFWLLARKNPRPFWIGWVCGIVVWIRPDALTLAGPLAFVLFFQSANWKERAQKGWRMAGGLLLGIGPYLVFNRLLGGAWWPNTLYAKQAEYAILQQIPYVERFFHLAALPLIGAGVLLVPGFFVQVWQSLRKREWLLLSAAFWWLGYSALYAAALPVDYQHGRYLIPAMPVFFVIGLSGTLPLLSFLQRTPRKRLLHFAAVVLLGLVWFVFYVQGGLAYSEDVAIIETEMIPAGQWIAANTPPDALIAAHDIGALGYFGRRKLIDLAGLISPEVIPFIRDEKQLADYIDRQGADYLVTFPKWYPGLIMRGEILFRTGGAVAPKAGGENMVVYRWIR